MQLVRSPIASFANLARLGGAAACLLAGQAYAQPGPLATAPEVADLPSVMIDLPAPQYRERGLGTITLAVGETGALTLDGSEAGLDELRPAIANLPAERESIVLVTIAGDAALREVQPVLAALIDAEIGNVEFLNSSDFRNFGNTQNDRLPAGPEQVFRGDTERYELPVLVNFTAASGQCAAILNGRTVSSRRLYDESFDTLDRWVMRAGGAEAIIATMAKYPVFATIQAPPETPWKCIGGAIFNLQAAGYPSVRIEVIRADEAT